MVVIVIPFLVYSTSGDKLAACIVYDTVPRREAVKELESEHSMVPEGLMRHAILSMSFSPEAFICIRHEFARSLSALSITSYVLGIGDRHMDNFLLNSANGKVVGIDFGHAFGTATQFLYIPELMPFRLTRQLVGVLSPHGYDGILKHDMIETLQVLEDNKDLLLDVLAIFVKEPLIAWDNYLQKIKRSVLAELNARDVDIKQWYVKEKIALVEKKLNMGNPAYITARELKHSTVGVMGSFQKYGLVDKIVQVAKGDKKYNLRANVGEYCESVTEQVNCLIDQATDPHILSKTFIGWAPYL